MPRIISDSDDDEEEQNLAEIAPAANDEPIQIWNGGRFEREPAEDNAIMPGGHKDQSHITDGEHPAQGTAQAKAKPYTEHDGNEGKTQSTGSTERLLREGHEAIAQYTPSTTGKRKRDISEEASSERRVSSATQMSTSSTKDTKAKSKLKRVKSSAETRAKTKDGNTWNLPPSSSPSGAKGHGDDARKMKPPPAKGVPAPSSTLTNTSSDERRAKELAQQANASQVSFKTPDRPKGETGSSKSSDESKYNPSATPSNAEKTPSESGSRPNRSSGPVVVVGPPVESIINLASASSAKHPKGKDKSEREGSPDGRINPSDETVIGLPAEKYQPRPTRSRSKRVASTQEPLATCDRPPTKKSKELRSQSTPNVVSADVGHLQEMGFPASQAKSALLKKGGNVEQAADMLLEGANNEKDGHITLASNQSRKEEEDGQGMDGSEDELSSDQVPVSKKVKKGRSVEGEEELEDGDSPEVVVVEAPRTRGRPKKGNKDVDDTIEAPIDQQCELDFEPEPWQAPQAEKQGQATGKKKGRGRPKKDQTKEEGPLKDANEQGEQDTVSATKPGSLIKLNQPNKKQVADDEASRDADEGRFDAHEAVADKGEAKTLEANESKENQPPSTPLLQKATTSKQSLSPTKPPSLSKGRVAYRVGLSKRTKIEPLLKVKRG